MEMHENSKKIAPMAFHPLPLGSIRPLGWLRNQLRIQVSGLTGHLDEFWPDIADSEWIGGKAEGWERGPYWLDGLVPLAFLLDDKRLTGKARRWMDYILTHQHEDGWLGPTHYSNPKYQDYDPWPIFVLLKAMTQYQEATGDTRIIPVMRRFLGRLDRLLDEKPLFVWGKSRWADLVLSIQWLYERTHEACLLDLAAKVQAQGYDWRSHFAEFRFKEKMKKEECVQSTHVVNNAMAIKQPAVWWRHSQDPNDRQAACKIMDTLDTNHGQVTGIFTGDEHYAGLNPSQGTELCAVVEYMFSLEVLLSIVGEATFGDRLERIAFNALPATFKPDMWAHQYDQQANQVLCKATDNPVWVNNGPEANIFGLGPHFGCCTSNMHQGWPKLTTHLWMRSPDGGLAAVAYAPAAVDTQIDGHAVHVRLETDYPFGEELELQVHTNEVVEFPLYLRIPAWARDATVQVGNEEVTRVKAGAFHRVHRTWKGQERLRVHLPMPVKVSRRYHGSVTVERGPLVYALRIDDEWRRIRGEEPHVFWEVYPKTPWNYGLEVDDVIPEKSLEFEKRAVGDCPFSPDGAPVAATVQGRRVPEWRLDRNVAGPLPRSPVHSSEPPETLTLIPYGCTNLRVSEFPKLEGHRDRD